MTLAPIVRRRVRAANALVALHEWRRFEAEINFFELTPEVASGAADLGGEHQLGGAHAVHLVTVARSAAVALASADPHLLDLRHAESIDVIALPDSSGTCGRHRADRIERSSRARGNRFGLIAGHAGLGGAHS